MKINSITHDLIYKLKEDDGLNYRQIASYLKEQGINVSYEAVRYHHKNECLLRTGEKERIYNKKDDNIEKSKLYELKKFGLTYEDISTYCHMNGKKHYVADLCRRCKEISKKKRKKVPKSKYPTGTLITVYTLQQEGKDYSQIKRELEKYDVKISNKKIKEMCENFLSELPAESLDIKSYKNNRIVSIKHRAIVPEDGNKKSYKNNRMLSTRHKVIIPDEEIMRLKEQGLSYARIAEELTKQGKPVSRNTIRSRCMEIYGDRKKEPKTKRQKVNTSKKSLPNPLIETIPGERVYELRQKKFSYEKILRILKKEGTDTSIHFLKKKIDQIYEEKGEENPTIVNRPKISDEVIYKLKEKGFTYQEIVDFYDVLGIEVSLPAIRKRCEKMYKKAGKPLPRVKYIYGGKTRRITRGSEETLEDLELNLQELLDTKSKTHKLLEDFIDLQNEKVLDKKEEKERV